MQPGSANAFSDPKVMWPIVLGIILVALSLLVLWPLMIVGAILIIYGYIESRRTTHAMPGGGYPMTQPYAPPYQGPPTAPVPPSPGVQPAAGTESSQGFCTQCGAPLKPGAVFCGACGARVG